MGEDYDRTRTARLAIARSGLVAARLPRAGRDAEPIPGVDGDDQGEQGCDLARAERAGDLVIALLGHVTVSARAGGRAHPAALVVGFSRPADRTFTTAVARLGALLADAAR